MRITNFDTQIQCEEVYNDLVEADVELAELEAVEAQTKIHDFVTIMRKALEEVRSR